MSRTEALSFWFGLATVGLTITTAVVGALAWRFSTLASEEGISEQRERADVAERQLGELQEHARPRTIAPSDRSAILESLQLRIPEGTVAVKYVSVTNEPATLAFELSDILKEAGWKTETDRPEGGSPMSIVPTGVVILVSDQEETPERATLLETSLLAGKLEPRLVRTPNSPFTPGTVTLKVGIKP